MFEGAVFAAAGWLLDKLTSDVQGAAWAKLKQVVIGDPAERALVRATDRAIREAVFRCAPDCLTGREVNEVVAVFNQLWPAVAPVDARVDSLLGRFGDLARAAVSRSLQPVDFGEDFEEVTSLSALQQQYGLDVDPDQFADQLCRCWVDSIRDAAITSPVLQPWADQLNHDLTHIGQSAVLEVASATYEAVGRLAQAQEAVTRPAGGEVYGAVSVPLEVARLDAAKVFSDAEVQDFTGRGWLIEQLDEFLATRRCGYVWLEAEAGLGKTAFAAWLVRTRAADGFVGHFSRQSSGGVPAALQNLAAQVITIGGLEHLAPGGMLPGWVATSGGFAALLHHAAPAEGGRRLVLVVDGLDEIDTSQAGGLPLGLPPDLPERVFVIGTYRTGYRPGVPTGEFRTLRISARDERNRADLDRYLAAVASEQVLAARLAECAVTEEEFCRLAAARCGGVWVYLRYLLAEIRLGSRRPDQWDNLPETLWEFYRRQLHRWQQRGDWPQLRSVLATLAAAAEAMDAPLLARLAGTDDPAWLQRCCDLWLRPFLGVSGSPRRYQIYHASFGQFLRGDPISARDGEPSDEAQLVAEQLQQALVQAHGRIAEDYLTRFGGLDGGLDTLADQPALAGLDAGYPLRHLAGHLEHAGRGEDLHRLLRCSRPAGGGRAVNVWYEAHDHAATLDGYLNDVDRARRLAEADTEAQIRTGRPPTGLGREVRYALMTASVHTMSNKLHPELLVALVNAGFWEHTRAMGHARRLADPHTRAQALTALAPHLPAELRPEAMAQALRAATAITSRPRRARALARLARWLPATQRPDVMAMALQAATGIEDKENRAQALVEMAPLLSADQLAQALQTAAAITLDDFRAQALGGLAPHLPADQVAQALQAASTITSQHHWVTVFVALAPHLPTDQLAQALTLTDEHARARALRGLAPHLHADQLGQPLQAAAAIKDEHRRAQALTGLAPHLPAEQRRDALTSALAAASAITHEYNQAQALTDLAPHLSADQLTQALGLATAITSPRDRVQALVTLLAYLPGEPKQDAQAQAVQTARLHIDNNSWGKLLAALAPHVPAEQRAQVLQAAADIPYPPERAQVIVDLAPHLHADQLTQALDVATAIADQESRAQALIGLVPQLPAEQRPDAAGQALAAASAITDDRVRVQVLADLAPHLPTDQLVRELLAVAATIADQPDRAEALARLAPHLPAEQRPDALAQALNAATTIVEQQTRAQALTRLAPRLPTEQRPDVLAQALHAAIAITPGSERTWTLLRLAPQLSAEQLPQVLQATMATPVEYDRVTALVRLAPDLPTDQLGQALQAATAISDEDDWVRALTGLAPYLPDDQLAQAAQKATAASYYPVRARALTGLLPYLPARARPAAVAHALTAATAINSQSLRANALTGLAPHLATDQLGQAVQAADAITDETDRVQALVALTPHLPAEQQPDVLAKALRAATAIPDAEARARALLDLAPHLPARGRCDVLAAALRAATAIPPERYRGWVLRDLASHLSAEQQPDLLAEALQAATAITDEDARGEVLTALAPRLPTDQLAQAVDTAIAITDEWHRGRTLGGIAPHLPADQLARTLQMAAAIAHEDARARALRAIAPHLPADKLTRALQVDHGHNPQLATTVLARAHELRIQATTPYGAELFRTALQQVDRAGCLRVLAESIEFLTEADSTPMPELLKPIREVCSWWS